MPPPSVRPATPVVEMMPPVVARLCSWVAALKSPQVAPPCARAVRFPGSTLTARIPDRSATTPSSTVPKPGTLWLPPRMARGSSCSLARVDGGRDIASILGTHDRGRATVDHGVVDGSCVVVAIIRRGDDRAADRSRSCSMVGLGIGGTSMRPPAVASPYTHQTLTTYSCQRRRPPRVASTPSLTSPVARFALRRAVPR